MLHVRLRDVLSEWGAAAAILAVGVTIAGLAARQAENVEHKRIESILDARAEWLRVSVFAHTDGMTVPVEAVGHFMSTQSFVHLDEFDAFAKGARHLGSTPIAALSWVPRVTERDRPTFEAMAVAMGLRDFRITRETRPGLPADSEGRREYFPVLHEALLRNRESWRGRDLATDAEIWSAAERARDLAAAIATVPTDADSDSFHVVWPVYSRAPPDTLEERRKELRGFTLGQFRYADVMRWIFGEFPSRDQIVHIFVHPGTGPALLVGSVDVDGATGALASSLELLGAQPELGKFIKPFEVLGLNWSMVVIFPGFAINQLHASTPLTWLVLGIVLTMVVAAYLWHQRRQTILVRAMAADLRLTVDQLVRTDSELRAIIDASPVPLLTIDDRAQIRRWNAAAETTFGWAAREVIGRHNPAIPPDRMAEIASISARLKSGDIVRDLETVRIRRDGTPFDASVSAGPIFADDGAYSGSVVMIADITERKQVERMKSEFVSTVSHELRTPLTSIAGSLSLVLGGVAGNLPERVQQLLGIAKKNCDRLVRLINDILDIEKIESGKMTFDMRPLGLVPLVRQAIEDNRAYAEGYSVEFELTTDGRELQVNGDSDRLTQVITNLLSNAVKFSPKGEQVTVAVRTRGERARIEVIDRGPGIPEEFRSRIFGKFAQADARDSRQKGGTGLGLSICKAIVEKHSGSIGFETTSGQGSRFYFELPLLAHSAVKSEMYAAGAATLLVCEDDPDVAVVVAGMLRAGGYNVDQAVDAETARAAITTRPYAALVLDLRLPGRDGLTLIRELRAAPVTRSLPIVVLSVRADEERNRSQGEDLGIVEWLSKPPSSEQLLATVSRAISRVRRRPRVLHVEDDSMMLQTAASALREHADVTPARSLAEARTALERESFDLAILDIGMPDGSGLELIPLLKDARGGLLPVILFSGRLGDAMPEGGPNNVSLRLSKTESGWVRALVRTVKGLGDQPPAARP